VARLRRGGHRPSMGRSAAAHRKNKIGAPPGRNQLIARLQEGKDGSPIDVAKDVFRKG
jgi:hypothetical protein